MRLILLLLVSVCVSSAHAGVLAFLKADPIIIVVQGPDTDSKRLYDSLDVEAVELPSSMLEKKVETPSGQIKIGCRHSELSTTTSCIIEVKREPNLEVSGEKKRAYLVSNINEDTTYLFDIFVKNTASKVPMYVSEKQDLAYSSTIDQFILSYQNID